MNPEEIPFQIQVEGKEYSGYLVPSGKMLPFGVPSSFQVFTRGEARSRISIEKGEWVMFAPEPFVKSLGEWIENHYE
jgi:hypothetical protein